MNEKRDSTVLESFLRDYKKLSPYEFEDMVCEMFRLQGWSDVQVTSRSSDKGRDVIGFEPDGNKAYIEVKRHKKNIGRPVVQKLHSIMMTEGVNKGYIVASSGFSPAAIEYANSVNIELIDGKSFLSNCKHLISGTPRPSALCSHIDIQQMKQRGFKALDKSIFSHPKPTSEFIQESNFSPFKYQPYTIIHFNLFQRFQNSTGSWEFNMVHSNDYLIIDPDGQTHVLDVIPFSNTIDMKEIQAYLEQNEMKVIIDEKPTLTSAKAMKKKIQDATTTIKGYVGRNNQHYRKKCRPNLSNIDILNKNVYWFLKTRLDLKISSGVEIRENFKEDVVSDLVALNVPSTNWKPKRVFMCQNCHDLMFKEGQKKKWRKCRNCGTVLCEECTSTHVKWRVFKKHWCLDCVDLMEKGEITDKKNRESLNNVKQNFRIWKQEKKLAPQLKFKT